jgi:hypothetical protein
MSRDTGSRGIYPCLIAQAFRTATSHVLLDVGLMADEGGDCKGQGGLSIYEKLFLTFNPIRSIYVPVEGKALQPAD